MKEMIKKALVDGYKEIAYTDKYIYGFYDKKVVYVAFSDNSTLDAVTKLDTSSDKTGYSLRFTPNKFQKEILKMGGKYFPLCSKEFFLNECKESIYNKGRVFEKMVTEYYGQEWGWDNVPFTEAGDIEIDGVAYQIKFEKATYVTEKRLARLRKKERKKIMENIMESLGLMVGKETVLFDVTTGEIISKERTEVLAYLKRNDGFYTLQVF